VALRCGDREVKMPRETYEKLRSMVFILPRPEELKQ